MTLTPDQVPDVAARILAMREREQVRLHRIADYMRGKHDSVYVPHGARDEYRWLLKRSVVNFLPLVVSVVSENLHVDGYLPTNPEMGLEGEDPVLAGSASAVADPSNPWAIFHANRMGSRQSGVHRAVAKYGIAYTVVLPGTMDPPDGGEPIVAPVIRPVSPRRLTALYADDVDDEWPQYAVEERVMRSAKGAVRVVWLYDDQFRYTLVGKVSEPTLYWPGGDGGDDGNTTTAPGTDWYGVPEGTPVIQEHGLGVCPVVRFLHDIDLDGEMDVSGEAEPLIPLQDQINTTTFNTLMAQQYAAFRQRWVTGMVPDDEEGRPREPFRSGVDRLWVAEDTDTKFGEFQQTQLGDFLEAREASIRHMSTIAQVPPYHLLGAVANLPLALDTVVPVPGGRTTMGELQPGDEVFAPDGAPVKVASVSPVFRDHECYRLTFDDGTQITADAQHRWETTHFVNLGRPGYGADFTECPECGWTAGTGRWWTRGPVTQVQRAIGIHRKKMHGVGAQQTSRHTGRETSVVTTRQIAETLTANSFNSGVTRWNHYVPVAKPPDGPDREYGIDPYVLGVWLGDGNRHNGYITSHKDDVDELIGHLRDCGEIADKRPYASGNCWLIIIRRDPDRCQRGHPRITSPQGDRICRECKQARWMHEPLTPKVNRSFRERMKTLGVWNDKHIPEEYFHGSFKQRLALLQGLMDTDGTNFKNGSVSFRSNDYRIAYDVHRLIQSLGHKTAMHERSGMSAFGKPWHGWMITWSALDLVFRLRRKRDRQRTDFGEGGDGRSSSPLRRYIIACEPVASVPVRCITVDSAAHQFCVTDAFVRTMNSAEALAAARDGLDRKVETLQGILSEPWKQTLRLGALAAGNKTAWADRTSTVVWRDTSARAFAATADALGKMAQMLGIPATELWSRIPGVSAEEVERWKQVAASQGALAELNSIIESQMTQGAQTTPPDDAEPFQGPALKKQRGV